MKIHPDQLEGIRSDTTIRTDRGTQTGASAFGDILSQEVAQSEAQSGVQATASNASLTPSGGLDALSALAGLQSTAAATSATSAENTIMNTVDSVLDKWGEYAQDLQGGATGEANLKQAYGVLEDIGDTVQQIKTDNPDLAQTNPDLQSMVSDLETMTETERFKINRGDYTA